MIKSLLDEAIGYENSKDWDSAIQCYLNALQVTPDDKDILLNLAACSFNKGAYEQALDIYLSCYQHPLQTCEAKEKILKFILEAYYQPNEAAFKTNYEKNIELLKSYQYNYIADFPVFDMLPCFCIPASDNRFYIMDRNTKTLYMSIEKQSNNQTDYGLHPGDCIGTANVFQANVLEQILRQTEDPHWINGIKTPIYVIWNNKVEMLSFLQITDYVHLITQGRIVFFDTYTNDSRFAKYFNDMQTIPFKTIIASNDETVEIKRIISEIHQRLNKKKDSLKEQITHKYSSYSREYYQALFNKPLTELRILFYTSRFTRVVQYATRDFMKACCNLGIKCDLLTDKSDIHVAGRAALMEKIAEFNPDIVFRINYFKSDFGNLPENLMFITWVQDPVVQIYDQKYAQKLGNNDYILAHCRSFWQQMIETGYPEERMNILTVPFDDNIFYQHQLTPDEQKYYEADVAVCGNYSLPEKSLQDLINEFTQTKNNESEKQQFTLFVNLIYDYFSKMILEGGFISNIEQLNRIIEENANRLEINFYKDYLMTFTQRIYNSIIYSLHRTNIVQILCERDFTFKIWGRTWPAVKEFAPYAMGLAQHGEELAKVYSASKIIIGTFSHYTAHFRIWEAMSCGALCMSRYLPPEDDWVDIREYFTEGEHFVFYHSPQDLLDKIHFYLNNETEQKRITANAQKRVREILTYSVAVQNALSFIKNDIMRKSDNTG